MKAEKRVKYYDEVTYNKEVRATLKNKDNAKLLKDSLLSFQGLNSVEEIENYLNEKTGFVNTTLSASAMGVEEQYRHILKYIGVINMESYTEDFTDVTDIFKEELKKSCTTYWSPEDQEIIETALIHVAEINKLSVSVRQSIVLNRELSFNFSEQAYRHSLQMLNLR